MIDARRLAIGKALKNARVNQGLTATQAAAKVKTSFWTWRRWEAGTHSIPAEVLPEVATLVAVSVTHLLGLESARQVAA